MTDTPCQHDWVHQETVVLSSYGGAYASHWERHDRYFCRHCLEIHELKREAITRDAPDWYRSGYVAMQRGNTDFRS